MSWNPIFYLKKYQSYTGGFDHLVRIRGPWIILQFNWGKLATIISRISDSVVCPKTHIMSLVTCSFCNAKTRILEASLKCMNGACISGSNLQLDDSLSNFSTNTLERFNWSLVSFANSLGPSILTGRIIIKLNFAWFLFSFFFFFSFFFSVQKDAQTLVVFEFNFQYVSNTALP